MSQEAGPRPSDDSDMKDEASQDTTWVVFHQNMRNFNGTSVVTQTEHCYNTRRNDKPDAPASSGPIGQKRSARIQEKGVIGWNNAFEKLGTTLKRANKSVLVAGFTEVFNGQNALSTKMKPLIGYLNLKLFVTIPVQMGGRKECVGIAWHEKFIIESIGIGYFESTNNNVNINNVKITVASDLENLNLVSVFSDCLPEDKRAIAYITGTYNKQSYVFAFWHNLPTGTLSSFLLKKLSDFVSKVNDALGLGKEDSKAQIIIGGDFNAYHGNSKSERPSRGEQLVSCCAKDGNDNPLPTTGSEKSIYDYFFTSPNAGLTNKNVHLASELFDAVHCDTSRLTDHHGVYIELGKSSIVTPSSQDDFHMADSSSSSAVTDSSTGSSKSSDGDEPMSVSVFAGSSSSPPPVLKPVPMVVGENTDAPMEQG